MKKIKCKRITARDKNERITAILLCSYIIVDEFSDARQEYTIYMYDEKNNFIGNLFCYKYEILEQEVLKNGI